MNDEQSREIAALLDSFAGVIDGASKRYDVDAWEGDAKHRFQAFVVLQTPEMQAVRAYLRWAHASSIQGGQADEPLLPMSVIAWMEEQ